MKKILGFIFISVLLIWSISFAAVTTDPDITGMGGSGVSEGSDVGFGNITATSITTSDGMTSNGTLVVTSGLFDAGAHNRTLQIQVNKSSSSTSNIPTVRIGSNNFSSSSGPHTQLELKSRIIQSGTAGYNIVFANVSSESTGSGDKHLFRGAVNNTDVFTVDSKGTIEGAGGVAFSGISTVTVDYAVGNFADDPTWFIECDAALGNISTTLPPFADKKGRLLEVKLLSAANGCYIDGNGAETIDGAAGQAITTQWNVISLIAGATEWLIR